MSFHVAIDLGATSGRVVLASFDGEKLQSEVVHRFEVKTREDAGWLVWDWRGLQNDIRMGLAAAATKSNNEQITSICCDAWAQDFALYPQGSEDPYLLPYSYRDPKLSGCVDELRANGILEKALRENAALESDLTSLCRLYRLGQESVDMSGRTLLHVAGLVHRDLCGHSACDFSLASASQLMFAERRDWNHDLIAELGIQGLELPKLHEHPIVLGEVTVDLGPAYKGCRVISGVGHDSATASAILGHDESYFAIFGTWMMVGCRHGEEVPELVDAARARFGLSDGRWGEFSCHVGMAPLQALMSEHAALPGSEAYASWETQWTDMALGEVVELDRLSWGDDEDVATQLASICGDASTSLSVTETGALILRSLGERCAMSLDDMGFFASDAPLRMLGGGSRNRALCRYLAKRLKRPVIAGPAEASVAGNLCLQLQALELVDATRRPEICQNSFEQEIYEPDLTSA